MVLAALDLNKADIVDVVFALLDDQLPSQFLKAAKAGFKFCNGATTAHIGAHVGILQRGGSLKLDREGRDYWIKPLGNVGAIEPVMFASDEVEFLPGHPIAKSPNSGYRLNPEFVEILRETTGKWRDLLGNWIDKDAIRKRLAFQARAATATAGKVDRKHYHLIQACIKHYAPHFLTGFQVLFTDDSDGNRISESEREALNTAGITIELGDAMPDVLLWNAETNAVWVIEAVTSDGEVDEHKVRKITAALARSGKSQVDFTTAYATWPLAARRQAQHRNIASGTYVWIADDPSKHYYADAFPIEDE
ncbi:MAG: BsuBI/PstI family type II restriction endonuclease [Planctomycetota bacterium]